MAKLTLCFCAEEAAHSYPGAAPQMLGQRCALMSGNEIFLAAGVGKLNIPIWLSWKGQSFSSLRLEAGEVTRVKAGMWL